MFARNLLTGAHADPEERIRRASNLASEPHPREFRHRSDVMALAFLGEALAGGGRYRAAVDTLRRAKVLLAGADAVPGKRLAISIRLAVAEVMAGDLAAAEAAFRGAQETLQESGNRLGEARMAWLLGLVAVCEGRLTDARTWLTRSDELASTSRSILWLAMVDSLEGQVAPLMTAVAPPELWVDEELREVVAAFVDLDRGQQAAASERARAAPVPPPIQPWDPTWPVVMRLLRSRLASAGYGGGGPSGLG